MSRNHIHFATGLPQDGNVISGMRSNCEIVIYIDLQLAITGTLHVSLSASLFLLVSHTHTHTHTLSLSLSLSLSPSYKEVFYRWVYVCQVQERSDTM